MYIKLKTFLFTCEIDMVCKVAKKPLVVTYTGLIQACLDSGSIQNGVYVFKEMHRVCSPNIVTCNIMLKSYVEHEMYDEAKDLFQKILDGSHDIKSPLSRAPPVRRAVSRDRRWSNRA